MRDRLIFFLLLIFFNCFMNHRIITIVLALFILSGCATLPPLQEMSNARQTISAAKELSENAAADEKMRIKSDGIVFIGHDTLHQYDAFGAAILMQIEAAGTAPYAGLGMIQNSNDADVGPLIFGKQE